MDVMDILTRVTDNIKKIAPIAAQLGIPVVSQVASLVNLGSSIANNVLNRIEQGEMVLNATDEKTIRDAIAEIEAANAELNEYITTH